MPAPLAGSEDMMGTFEGLTAQLAEEARVVSGIEPGCKGGGGSNVLQPDVAFVVL